MSNRKWIAGVTLAAMSGAIACGPFFPWQLLDDRAATLKATPVNSFFYEASHLAPAPKDKLKAVENTDFSWARQMSERQPENAARELGEAESAGLSNNQILLLQLARKAASGAEALEKGKGLPIAVLHYTAGAVAWNKGDYAFAKQQFLVIQNTPPKESQARAVWAQYMLARVDAATHDDDAAAADFRYARMLAQRGAPDPLGLAVASFGEEARLHLGAAEGLLEAGGGTVVTPASGQPASDSEAVKFAGSILPDRAVPSFRAEIAKAVKLYAEQAAHGSDSGVQSLRIVAEFLLDRTDRVKAVASEPAAQKLMVAYALKRLNNTTIHVREWWVGDDAQKAGTGDAGLDATLPVLVAALEKQARPAGADRLAALCYNLGNWQCAENFAAKAASPLGDWVKAKLATQKGDLKAAAGFYASAVHGFPTSDALEDASRKQVLGESSVMALARGDYVDALAKLWPVSGTYWSDVAYIAERVLTVDELKGFVDANVPPGKAGATPAAGTPFDSRTGLRDLLARRLMRAERSDEAIPYFSDAKTADAAKAYAAALKRAKSAWGKVDRAEALFQAATIARQNGMEVLGSEGPPDSYYTGGEFDGGLGRDTLKGEYITNGENERFNASNVVPDERFHYRYVAVGEVNAAADLVPAKSQAFAAMLCHAVSWSSRDEGRAKALWQRYIKHGARVPFAKTFGVKCPAPDFKGAIVMERKLMVRDARRYVSHNRWWFAGGGAAGMLAIAALVILLVARRKRAAT